MPNKQVYGCRGVLEGHSLFFAFTLRRESSGDDEWMIVLRMMDTLDNGGSKHGEMS